MAESVIDLLKHIFSLQSMQNFLRVRNDEGKLDWEQVTASVIQSLMLLVIIGGMGWIIILLL